MKFQKKISEKYIHVRDVRDHHPLYIQSTFLSLSMSLYIFTASVMKKNGRKNVIIRMQREVTSAILERIGVMVRRERKRDKETDFER